MSEPPHGTGFSAQATSLRSSKRLTRVTPSWSIHLSKNLSSPQACAERPLHSSKRDTYSSTAAADKTSTGPCSPNLQLLMYMAPTLAVPFKTFPSSIRSGLRLRSQASVSRQSVHAQSSGGCRAVIATASVQDLPWVCHQEMWEPQLVSSKPGSLHMPQLASKPSSSPSICCVSSRSSSSSPSARARAGPRLGARSLLAWRARASGWCTCFSSM
mmetsp:Transcript_65148/g.169527  ORF Transcript_65148/g.169527 Transcript_65148/m.169527 type:complete len:214 (-) Transcript_65148:1728-2369(-)